METQQIMPIDKCNQIVDEEFNEAYNYDLVCSSFLYHIQKKLEEVKENANSKTKM